MKTLAEIIEAVRNGERPDYDDLRYAICALEGLATFHRMALMRLAEGETKGTKPFLTSSARWQLDEHLHRERTAGDKPPKEWVGWNNDPENPEFLARRKQAIRLMEKFASKPSEGDQP